MKKIDRLSVFFNNGSQKRLVGTLALYKERLAVLRAGPDQKFLRKLTERTGL